MEFIYDIQNDWKKLQEINLALIVIKKDTYLPVLQTQYHSD